MEATIRRRNWNVKKKCLHNVYTPRESCFCLCDTWIREKNKEIRGIFSVQPCAFFSFPSILAEKFTQASLPVTGRSAATYDRHRQKPEAGVYRYRVRVSVECKRKKQTKRQQAKKFSEKSTASARGCASVPSHHRCLYTCGPRLCTPA